MDARTDAVPRLSPYLVHATDQFALFLPGAVAEGRIERERERGRQRERAGCLSRAALASRRDCPRVRELCVLRTRSPIKKPAPSRARLIASRAVTRIVALPATRNLGFYRKVSRAFTIQSTARVRKFSSPDRLFSDILSRERLGCVHRKSGSANAETQI